MCGLPLQPAGVGKRASYPDRNDGRW